MEENKADEKKVEGNSVPKSALKQPKNDSSVTPQANSSSPDKTVKATIEQKPVLISPVASPVPDRPKTPEPPEPSIDINPLLPPNATLDVHQFRSTSPIPEDPNEDASPNNSRRTSESAKISDKSNPVNTNPSPQKSLDSIPSRPTTPTNETKPSTPIPKIETPPDDEARPKSPTPKTPDSGKLSPLPDTTSIQASQGSPSHGKSKTSGKNLTGWF